MIILHENLPAEAKQISKVLEEAYGFGSVLVDKNLTNSFLPIQEFGGYWDSSSELQESLAEYGRRKIMVITPRDLYSDNVSKKDDWIFGYNFGNLSVVSAARMKRYDSEPSNVLQVPEDLYIKRLQTLAIHEIGHGAVRAPHFKVATWVNDQTGHTLRLGAHCTDNTCVMYEIVDIRAPKKEEGHMLLGEEKRYDAGLDDVLERINPDWFCDNCKNHIKIDDSYRDFRP